MQPIVDRRPFANPRPSPTFDVVIEPQLVRRNKRCFRRTPGMKPDVIQPVSLANADDPPPRVDIGRRVTGEWENAALEGAAKEDLVTI